MAAPTSPEAREGGTGRTGSGEHGTPGAPGTPGVPGAEAPAMTHRQIMEALSGLLLGMFVAVLSSTVVVNALPRIISELDGGQSAYAWVVTAALLAMTASTPLWGKLADLFSKKLLVQTALVVFVLASAGAGLAQDTGTLIAFRAVQGVGVGGLAALSQIVMAMMIPPRERGRYNGYLGAVFAAATVSGPLLGGVITDTPWLGWRWCFYVGVPFAAVALVVLHKTLELPVARRRDVRIDWPGALLITAAASLLLIWVTLAGGPYAWLSWQTYAMVGGALVLALAFVLAEARAAEPVLPLHLFRDRTVALASLASLLVGVAMFGTTAFLGQYFQLARGQSPTLSGLLTFPLVAGLTASSTVSGRAITRTGRWKGWLVAGGVLLVAGVGLLGTLRHGTPYWYVGTATALVGLGLGMLMQNLVLAAQNQAAPSDLGAASSAVVFFRSLGGAAGVSVLGAVLALRVDAHLRGEAAGAGPAGGALPDPEALPEPLRTAVRAAFGHGIADVYLYATPAAVLVLLLVLCVREVPLRTRHGTGDGGRTPVPGGTRAGGGRAAHSAPRRALPR